jgi:hypothetical protein
MRVAALVSLATLAACASTKEGSVALVTGDETDVFTRAPAPTTLVVEAVDLGGNARELSRTPLPGGDLSLGDFSREDVAALRVRATDAAGKVLVSGESLYFQYGALADSTLEVFVQRNGELARMPRAPASSFEAPSTDVVVGRFVLQAKGTATSLYDLLSLRAFSSAPTLPRPAMSLTSYGTVALVIDDKGASSFDLSSGETNDVATPSGGTYAEVAGGASVRGSDGSVYVVGATRDGAETARILRVSKDGNLSFVALSKPRAGACATYVTGRGLVVYGGSASAAGGEVLADGATVGAPLPYPADAVKGCGLAALDTSKVVVAGGRGALGDTGAGLPARVLDLSCASGCSPAPWQGIVPLVRADAIATAADAVLVAGDDASGASRVFRASSTELREVPLKIGRRGARLVALPTHALGVVGGAPVIESYRD